MNLTDIKNTSEQIDKHKHSLYQGNEYSRQI